MGVAPPGIAGLVAVPDERRRTPAELSHLERLIDAETVEAVWHLHTLRMAEFGFDRMIYGFTRFHSGKAVSDLSDALILSSHSPEYNELWLSGGNFQTAPMTRWVLNNEGACSWRWIVEQVAQGNLTEAERQTLALSHSLGVRAGYTIGFGRIEARQRGAIGLCARAGLDQNAVDAIWHEHGATILVMNKLLHLRVTTLPYTPPQRALTQRQREVLEWVSDGKSVQDIATILGLTATTVDKHLRLARAALGAETTAQAVLKASFFNQIFQVGG
jgi:LuxR family transcriptional regulator